MTGISESTTNVASGESAKKKAAISRIFPIKKSNSSGGKGGIKVEHTIKDESEDSFASPEAVPEVIEAVKENLKPRRYRPDGRPILACRISFSSIKKSSTERSLSAKTKRERRTSVSSSASISGSSPAATGSGKGATLKRSLDEVEVEEVKTEATRLDGLPGSSKQTEVRKLKGQKYYAPT